MQECEWLYAFGDAFLYVYSEKCFCGPRSVLVSRFRRACAARGQCLCGSRTVLVRLADIAGGGWNHRFLPVAGLLFFYFVCKHFAISLCVCPMRKPASKNPSAPACGPKQRILER